jgi:nicotinamidase-related amidase
VEKTCFTMLAPQVKQWLESPELQRRRSAVIFGLEAHVCVQQTTLDLLERGYDVHVLVDGVSSQVVSDRAVAFARMQGAGAFLTTSESVLMELIRGKEHEHFKPISALLKTRPSEPLEF